MDDLFASHGFGKSLVLGNGYERFAESLGLKEMSRDQAPAIMRRRIYRMLEIAHISMSYSWQSIRRVVGMLTDMSSG